MPRRGAAPMRRHGVRRRPAPTAAEAPGRRSSCRRSRNDLLDDLDANREALQEGSRGAAQRSSISHLLPHFDTEYAARLVLGKHWRTATPEQRKRFVEAFYQSLMRELRRCAARVHERSHEDPAVQGRPRRDQRDRAHRGQAQQRHAACRSTTACARPPQGWKAWDVTIEGISYVKNFRTDFGSEIEQKGLDAVIQRLESQNAKPTAASAQKTSS